MYQISSIRFDSSNIKKLFFKAAALPGDSLQFVVVSATINVSENDCILL